MPAREDAHVDSVEGQLDVATVRHQLEYIRTSVAPSMGIALLMFVALRNADNTLAMSLWCTTYLFAKLLAVVHSRRTLRAGVLPSQVRRITWIQGTLYAIQGAMWGALAWIVVRPEALMDSLLALVVITGMASNALPYLAANLPVFVVFVLSLALPVSARLAWVADPVFHTLALVSLVVPLALITQARSSARATRVSYGIRNQNIELMEKLRKESEKTRKAYLAAQQANAAKSRFLAAASHDLRQPVHSLGLFLEALGHSPLAAEQKLMLAKARSVSETSVSMLNALLEFSRIEAGAIKPSAQAVDLQALLSKMELEYAQHANDQNLVYRARETRLTAHADPLLVELMLRNLVTNAIRYTLQGGILVACRQRGSNVVLEVWDTGIGIPTEKLDDIFEEFTQLQNPERDQRKGLGLGLAIVRGFARLMGAELSVSSRLGRGSVFRIGVPLSQGLPSRGAAPLPGFTLPGGLRILVVDDDESVRSSTLATVASWGCEGEAAETVEEARAAARRCIPDVLISDYRLRELRTGADVITGLREECGSDIPSVLITGDTAPERIREALRLGVPLLHKPVTAEALRRAVFDVLAAAPR